MEINKGVKTKENKIKRESIVSLDVIRTANKGILYKDDLKLKVEYNEKDNEVYLEAV